MFSRDKMEHRFSTKILLMYEVLSKGKIQFSSPSISEIPGDLTSSKEHYLLHLQGFMHKRTKEVLRIRPCRYEEICPIAYP